MSAPPKKVNKKVKSNPEVDEKKADPVDNLADSMALAQISIPSAAAAAAAFSVPPAAAAEEGAVSSQPPTYGDVIASMTPEQIVWLHQYKLQMLEKMAVLAKKQKEAEKKQSDAVKKQKQAEQKLAMSKLMAAKPCMCSMNMGACGKGKCGCFQNGRMCGPMCGCCSIDGNDQCCFNPKNLQALGHKPRQPCNPRYDIPKFDDGYDEIDEEELENSWQFN
jgi:hypothetical protein